MKKIILVLGLLIVTGCAPAISEDQMEVIGYPVQLGEMHVQIEYQELVSSVICYDDYIYNQSFGHHERFNYTFLDHREYDTRSIIENDIIYNVRYKRLYPMFDSFADSDVFLDAMSKFNDSYSVECFTRLVDYNQITAEVWDEGHQEVKNIGIYERLELYCEEEFPNQWSCEITNIFVNEWTFTEDLEQEIIQRVIE